MLDFIFNKSKSSNSSESYMYLLPEEELFYEPRKLVLKEIENIPFEPEMSEFESAFLCGLLKKYRPKKILEVGIAAGGTSAMILKCLDMLKMPQAHLISVDLNKQFYRNKEKESGFLADQVKIKENIKHTKILGKYLPEIIETIGKDIDFFILDTVHSLPGELLDFPVALPFLAENCVFCLHDTAYHILKPQSFSNQLLYDSIVADKIISYGPSKDNQFYPNIGAAKLNSDTRKYFPSYFNAFSMPWAYMPKDNEINIYKTFYQKYYQNIAFIFDLCYKANKKSLAKRQDISKNNRKPLNSVLFDYFIYRYKQQKFILHNIDFQRDTNMNWIALNVSSNNKVHYEIYISSDNKIHIALHMASKEYDSFYEKLLNNKALYSLNNFKPLVKCDNYTKVDYNCNSLNVDNGVKILNFLVGNTINMLYDLASDDVKLSMPK